MRVIWNTIGNLEYLFIEATTCAISLNMMKTNSLQRPHCVCSFVVILMHVEDITHVLDFFKGDQNIFNKS